MELDNQLKALLQELGVALHQAVTRDDHIKTITERIKISGYDIYLIMEANIALDRRDDAHEGQLYLQRPEDKFEMEAMGFNRFDEHFLAGLQIKSDE